MATKHENLVKACKLLLSEYGFIPIAIKVGKFRSLYSEAIIDTTDNEGKPDLIACSPKAEFWGVEIKVGKDRLGTAQKAFSEVLTKRGGKFILVRDTIDKLKEELEAWKILNQ